MANKTLRNQDIVEMLSELRNETPEYPPELIRSRKTTFLKRAVDLKISGEGQSGKGGGQGGAGGQKGGGGVTWAELSGGAAATGSSSKMAIAVGVVVVLLAAAFLFRDQIVDILEENKIINVEETAASSIALAPTEQATATPTALAFGAPSGVEATKDAPGNAGNLAATEAASGLGNNGNSGNNGGGPATGSDPYPITATPPPGLSQNPGTPTPPPPQGLVGRLRFLVCVLRNGADGCE